MNKILIFAAVLLTIYIGIFFIPNRVEILSLNPEKISEIWRFITYPFTHLNTKHLIENLIGLSLVAFIARELKTAFNDFSSTYLSSGFLSVIPVWLILSFTALGASNAIFGGFGLITQNIKKFQIKSWYIIVLLIIIIFLSSITSYFSYGSKSEQFIASIKQSIAHFSGLIFGIGFFFFLSKIKPILTKKKKTCFKEVIRMRIKTGIEGLDNMLSGGLLKGRNILLSGPCGSGKSILGMQFLYNGVIVFNEPGLYVTLEETKEKFYEDMAKFGMDLTHTEKTGRFTLIGGPIAGLKKYMTKVDASIKNIVEEIEEIVKEKRIKRVVIDSINLLTMLLKDDDERRKALAMISNSLSALGCTAILISETKEGSMDLSRYGMEEFVVDGVIVLYLVRQGSKFSPGIAIRKMRGTKHEKEIKYYEITDQGIFVHPEETLFTDIK